MLNLWDCADDSDHYNNVQEKALKLLLLKGDFYFHGDWGVTLIK